MMINLSQLYSILNAYDRVYPEDRHSVAEFRASKQQAVNELIGQLERCQNAAQDHKSTWKQG